MNKQEFKSSLKKVKYIIYDFDGVLTDNKVYVDQDGRETVLCNRSDGLATREISALGVAQVIVSTETNKVVSARARKLQIKCVQGVKDKAEVVRKICEEEGILVVCE